MNKRFLAFIMLIFSYQTSFAGPEMAPMSVWVNEAIVATYSFSYKNYMEDQKQIAKYYTANAWMAYTKALMDAKLMESIQKNQYIVSAVATEPPAITEVRPGHWEATMGLLVNYQNSQYKQQQNLKISINFAPAPAGQGVRGYSITSIRTTETKPPCKCSAETPAAPAATGNAK